MSKVERHKQNIKSLIFKDNIGKKVRNSSFSFKVLNDAGKELELETDYSFNINPSTQELEFQKKKHYDNYGTITYDFNLYTKSSLFAISNNELRTTLQNIFEDEKCDNILASHFAHSKKELSLYYTTDVDFSKINKEYIYENPSFQKNITTVNKNINENVFREMVSVYQKEIFFGLIYDHVYSKASKYFHKYDDKMNYINKALSLVFDGGLYEEENMDISGVLDVVTGEEYLEQLLKSDFPLEELKQLYTDEKISFKDLIAEKIRNFANGNVLIGNVNTKNSEIIDKVLLDSFSFGEQVFMPSFELSLDKNYHEEHPSKHHLNSQALGTLKEQDEAFFNASMLRAIDGYHHYGSPAHKQSKAFSLISVIEEDEELQKSLAIHTELPISLFLLNSTGENDVELLAKTLNGLCRGEDKVAFPVKLSDGSIMVTVKQHNAFLNGGILNDSVDLSQADYQQVLDSNINKDNIYNFMINFANRIDKNISIAIKQIAVDMFDQNTKKGLNGYLNSFNKKIADNIKNAPRNEVLEPILEKITNAEMAFLSGMNHIGKKEKIFPDIINLKNPNRMSLEEISTSLFHTTRWLMIPEYHQTIKEQLERNGYVVPEIKPYKFNLIDPSKNLLSEEKKQSIVSTKSHAGILNFQILPTIMEIDSDNEIEKFLEYSAKAIAKPIMDAKGEEEFQSSFEEIYAQMEKENKQKLQECKYVLTKITPYFEDGIVKQHEKFVGVDENLVEKISFNTPVFNFFSILRDEKLLNIENRTKNASFAESDIKEIFEGIKKYTDSILNNNSELFKKIDTMFLPLIEKTLNQQENFNFNISNKLSLLSIILKKNGDLLTRHLIEKKEDSVENKIEAIFSEYSDEKSIHLKSSLKSFYVDNLKGKEHLLLDTEKEEKIRELYQKRFGKDDDRINKSFGAIQEASAEIERILNSDIKAVLLRAYSVFIGKKIEQGLNVTDKNKLINDFLYKILGLESHQALEVKGFLALHKKENINVELLFWEARTKKSRTMMAILLLVSIIKQTPSVFFLQNKNYDDLVGQAFDMLPFIVTESSILLGTNIKYKAEKASLPVVLSEFIFPNLVSSLKRNNYLKNPTATTDSPANILAKKYTNDFYKIYSSIKDDPKNKLIEAIEENGEEFKELSYYAKLIEKSSSSILDGIVATTYFYTVKLFLEGYLNAMDKKDISEVVRKKVRNFINEYTQSGNVSEITEKHPAKIVFAGKQFVDTFVAMNKEDIVVKTKNENNDQVFTQLDIEPDLQYAEDVENTIPLEVTRKNIIDSLVLSPKQNDLAEKSYATLFSNNLSKTDDEYISTVVNNLNEHIGSALKWYAAEKVNDEIEKESILLAHQVFKKIITSSVANVLKDFEANSRYIDTELYMTDVISYNEKPIKITALKTDLLMAEKVQGSILNYLFDNEIIDNKERAEEIVGDLFYSAHLPQEISKTITLSGMEMLTRRVYFKEGAKTNSINKSVTHMLPVSMEKKIDKIDVILNFSQEINGILGLSKKDTKTDSFEQYSVAFKTETINPNNPSFFTKNVAVPTKISISQESSKPAKLEILEAVDSINKAPVSLAKKDTKKLSSGYLWELQKKQIGAVSIDEAHKNVTGNKKKTTTAVLRKIEEIYPQAIQIISTGTPNKYGEFIEVVSGNIGNKTKRTIDKYCGLYKIDSLYVTAIMEALRVEPKVAEVIDNKIMKFLKDANNTKSMDASYFAGAYSRTLKEELDKIPEVRGIYSSLKRIKNSNERHYDHDEILANIFQSVYKMSSKNTLQSNGDGVEIFEKVLLDPKYGIAKKTAGVTNPIGLSEIFNFFVNSNLSIKRPSKGVKYDIVDHKQVAEFGRRSVNKNIDMPEGKELALQMEYLLAKKTYSSLAGAEIFNTYRILFEIAEKGIRENCETLLGLSLTAFNDLCNRSQVSVEDSLLDVFMRSIIKGETIELTDDRQEVINLILQSVDYLQTEKFSELRALPIDSEKNYSVEVLEGIETELDRESIKEFKNATSAAASKNISFSTKHEMKDENVKYVYLDRGGVNIAEPKTEEPAILRGIVPFVYTLDEKLPNLEFDINLGSPDDLTIIENISFNKQAIELSTKHLNMGENTRHMTTRIALTEEALLIAIQSAVMRDNKERALNIVVSTNNKKVLSFVSKIIDMSSQYLKDYNINITRTDPNNFNDACQPSLNKDEQLMVVGNFASLAEGVAMDFIQRGFYVGALSNIESSIQSFARQNGHRQQESSFYLANNGNLARFDGRWKQGDVTIRNYDLSVEKNINDNTQEAIIMKANSLLNGIKIQPSYTGYRNNNIMEHFRAYELIMTGDFKLLEKEIAPSQLEDLIKFYRGYENIETIAKEENEEEIIAEEDLTMGAKL